MIGLLRSEILRARSRRVVTMLFVSTLIAVTVGIAIAIATAQEPTQADIDRGQVRYERELERCLGGVYGPPEDSGYDSLEEMCAEFVRPEYFGPEVARFRDLEEILVGTAFMVILLGAVVGATLGGADWSTGSIATLLVWEPRRLRILAARAIAVALVAVALTIAAQVILAVGLTVFVAVRGTFDETPAGFLGDLGTTIGRISLVATLFALMGLSLAMIGRSTVAGLGVLLGYLIVVEGFLSNLVFWVQKVTFGRAASAAVTDEPLDLIDQSTIPPTIFELVPGRAWLTLGAWAAALMVLAAVAFRGRDVT